MVDATEPAGSPLLLNDYRELLELSKALQSGLAIESVLEHIVERSIDLLAAERGFLVERDGSRLTFYRRWGSEEPGAVEPVSTLIVEDALQQSQILLVSDAQVSERYRNRESVRRGRVRSVLAAPLERLDNLVLYFETGSSGRRFGERERALLAEILGISSGVLTQSVRQMAFHETHNLAQEFDFRGVVARDPVMLEVLHHTGQVARTSEPVLIQGPSGSGKDGIAQALHRNSDRADGPYVVANCGGFAPSLLASELFGHVKGSFSGADRPREGLIRSAEGGTLFFDEIGDMPLELQAHLLRTVEYGEVRPVGSDHVHHADVRFVAATHKNLEALVESGEFRQDLYYRLAAITIEVPPLAERTDDILPLFYHFLSEECDRMGRPIPFIDDEVEDLIVRYGWRKNNVRQLKNEVARLIVVGGDSGRISAADLSFGPEELESKGPPPSLKDAEIALLRRHLDWAKGNRSKAARNAGITREGLRKKIKRFELE